MAKNTKSTKLNSKVAVLESEIALLIEELNQSRLHYYDNERVIESILSLGETYTEDKP